MSIALTGITFGQTEAAKIVGGKTRLFKLIGQDEIRVEKSSMRQNARWNCDAWDVLRHAIVKYKPIKKKRNGTNQKNK